MTQGADSKGGGSATRTGHGAIHVLHVDDDPDFVELTKTVLQRISDEFTVTTETSIAAGLARLDDDSIDCIVSDYQLPDRNGIDFLREVRETRPEVPFFLFTGKGGEDVASEAISAGVTDYLQKSHGSERYELLANRIRNAVEQARTDRALKDLRRRYERVARASADAFVDWETRSDHLWWSEGLERTFGYTSEETHYRLDWWQERIHPGDRQRVDAWLEEAFENQRESIEMEYRFRRADGTYAHVIGRGSVSYEGDKPVRVTGALIDITTRKERQRTLERLHRTSQELIRAETMQDVCDVVVRSAAENFGSVALGLYLWNEDEGVLQLRAPTQSTDELSGDLPNSIPRGSLAWNVFLDGETAVFEDVREHEHVYERESPVRNELIVPLGDYGVLMSGSTSSDSFAENDVQFAETLAANATAALRRAERESELREKRRALREQNTTLTRLNSINSIIRTIQRDIVKATTRSEIEQALCDDLVQADQYQFCWVGRVDESGQLSPSVWAGADGTYLDDLLGGESSTDATEQLPARKALETGEAVTVQRFREKLDEQPWLRTALNRGFQSLIAIPLVFRDSSYGVVEIYASQSTPFSTDEREMLREVCDVVANALNAIERRQALVVQSDTELEFRIEDVDDVLFRLARHTGCTIDLDSMLPKYGGKWLLYLTVSDCDGDDFRAVADRQVAVERAVSMEGENDMFEVVVSEFEIATVLGEQGAKLHSLRAGPTGGDIVVRLPQTTDVNPFIEACASVFSDAELVRRTQMSSDEDGDGVTRLSADLLTDRQRDVLEVAHRNGFFEWPRESTGKEIASRMGVSPPTFHRHIRVGTHNLIESIFE